MLSRTTIIHLLSKRGVTTVIVKLTTCKHSHSLVKTFPSWICGTKGPRAVPSLSRILLMEDITITEEGDIHALIAFPFIAHV